MSFGRGGVSPVIKTQWSTNPFIACNTSEVKSTTSVLSVDPKVVVKRDAQDVRAFTCLTKSSRGEIAAENVGSSGFKANASFVTMWESRKRRESKSAWILARSGSDADEDEPERFLRTSREARQSSEAALSLSSHSTRWISENPKRKERCRGAYVDGLMGVRTSLRTRRLLTPGPRCLQIGRAHV